MGEGSEMHCNAFFEFTMQIIYWHLYFSFFLNWNWSKRRFWEAFFWLRNQIRLPKINFKKLDDLQIVFVTGEIEGMWLTPRTPSRLVTENIWQKMLGNLILLTRFCDMSCPEDMARTFLTKINCNLKLESFLLSEINTYSCGYFLQFFLPTCLTKKIRQHGKHHAPLPRRATS